MKKKVLILLISIVSMILSSTAYGLEKDSKIEKVTDELILQQLDSLDISEIEGLIDKMNNDKLVSMPKIDIKSMIISFVKGEADFTVKSVLASIVKRLFKEIVINSKLLSQLMFISILCAILNNLSNSFGNSVTGEIAFYGCYLIIVGIAIKSFIVAMNIGQVAIDNMVSFMQALIPVLLTLLIAVGSITASAIFKPIIVASIGITSTIIKDIIIPLILFTAVLSIINNFTSKIQISKLATLLKQISIGLIGLILTSFLGVISIQGVLASSVDGVTLRTARFAMDRFIPIVGGFMSEAIDAVFGCSLLLKNAIGVVGLMLILMIISLPILKILSLIFIYKITAALIEPITDKKIVDCLNDMSSLLTVLCATVVSVAIMFFIAVTAVVGAGNITAMIR